MPKVTPFNHKQVKTPSLCTAATLVIYEPTGNLGILLFENEGYLVIMLNDGSRIKIADNKNLDKYFRVAENEYLISNEI